MTLFRARRMGRLLWTSCALALGVTALLASCSGTDNITYGTAVVTMGTADGGFSGFSSYIIDIDEITLTRNDGLVIEPLAEPETVDLVKLHDHNELVEAPAIPVGTYTSLAVVLDYTEGAVVTVDVNGVVTNATVNDTAGDAMSSTTLTVTFDPKNPLVINGGECVRLHIDLNLAASNTINTSTSPPTVVAQPVLSATVAPEDQTVYRARGLFVVTQPSASNFIVNMRPFVDLVSALGALTVNVSSSTYFNINGTVYTGSAGLAAMSKLEVSTPVASYGTLDSFATITPSFNATAVYAGVSLESPLSEYVTGTVSAVSGNTLTVHGSTYLSGDNGTSYGVGYVNEVPITIGSATTVTEDGVAASGLTTKSVSVGQVINISGQGSLNSSNDLIMDATQGAIRLQPTPVWGTLNSAAAGSMSLDVLSLGAFEPGVFNFAGTGTSAANDALASSYAVDTGALNESAVAPGTLLQTSGLVTPLGAGPPDFTAASVTLASATPQTLVVEWNQGGTAAPFTSASSSGIVVDLANPKVVSTLNYIATGPTRTALTSLPASPTIVFAPSGLLTLSVGNDAAMDVFNTAAGFASQLTTTFNGSNYIYRLVCVGQYSSATNTFTANYVIVNLT